MFRMNRIFLTHNTAPPFRTLEVTRTIRRAQEVWKWELWVEREERLRQPPEVLLSGTFNKACSVFSLLS
jgi:hypothetical protein